MSSVGKFIRERKQISEEIEVDCLGLGGSVAVLCHSVMADSLYQSPLSMEILQVGKQECPPPRGLPNPGIEPRSPALQADTLPSAPPENPPQEKSSQKPWGLFSLGLISFFISHISLTFDSF